MSTPLYNWTVTEFVYPSTLPTSINLTTDNAAGASPVIAHIQPVPSGAISLGPNNVTIPVNKDTPWENYIWFLAPVAPPHISWRRNDASPIAPSSSGTTSTPSLASTTVTSSAENIPNPKVASTLPPTSSPTAKPGKQTSTVPSGAAAGAAIGCLIAGAVIAALVLWFCWGRRKRSRAQNSDASGTALVHHEKGFSSSAIPLETRSPAALSTLDTYPMPLEDKAITGEISKISNSIKNHVQSFYHASEISPGLLDIDDVKALGSDLPVPAATLGSLLDNRANREIALRFCVAWVVFSKMRPDASPSTSLLPTEVAECLRKMVDPGRGSGAHTLTVARWRVMTAELLKSSYVRNPFTASDSRNSSIHAALSTLETVLQPYADSRMDNAQRRRNLEEILKRSALFAFTLFSQPSTWDFDWREERGVKSNQLCIFPALVQLTSEPSRPQGPPEPFSEAMFRSLDS